MMHLPENLRVKKTLWGKYRPQYRFKFLWFIPIWISFTEEVEPPYTFTDDDMTVRVIEFDTSYEAQQWLLKNSN